MFESIIAKRYAKALFQIASAKDQLKEIRARLADAETLIDDAEEFSDFMAHPLIPHEAKTKVLNSILETIDAGEYLRNFFMVMLDRRQLRVLPQIIAEYNYLVDDKFHHTTAYVTSAREMLPEEKEAIRESMEKRTGLGITVVSSVDAGILGGVSARVHNKIYDGSLKKRLENICRRIAE